MKAGFVWRSFVCCTLGILPAVISRGQAPPAVEKDTHGITLSGTAGSTRVEVWGDRIFRVTHFPGMPSRLAASLPVIATPDAEGWTSADKGNEIVLTAAHARARIEKATGRVRFFDENGAPVLGEEQNGVSLTPASVGAAKHTLAVEQRFVLDPGEAIYGLGQHPWDGLGIMNYVGQSVPLWQQNTKVGIPFLLSSKGYGVLWDNAAITNVDVGKSDARTLSWQSEAGSAVDYYFVLGPKPDEVIAGYRWLTGPAPMFPRWAWGFWQSKERYKTQDEIVDVVSQYRKLGVPLDGIVQDWQYWPPLNQQTAAGGWGSHEFDPSRYPDPQGMVKEIHDMHAHMMISVWPKFDVTDSGVSIPNLQSLEAVKGAYDPVIPFVYPKGRGKWYDPFNDDARRVYWHEISRQLSSLGIDAWWLDASEPELSGSWGEFRTFNTGKGPGALVFNAYPLEHTRAVYEGQRADSRTKRVFILTRSAYAGQQRNAAVTWSGDIHGTWDVLQKQIPAGLNFAASGIPYWNTDIGGFFGSDPGKPDYVELFTRWFQFGAFNPMFRVHGTDKPKEYWRFDPATQKILLDYLRLRYHLLPYIYSVSWMVTNSGYTMMRPLVMDFPDAEQAREITDQFMFGPALLVNPVTKAGATRRQVYLPSRTKWIDFRTGESFDGGQTINAASPIETMPLLVRAGSILPYGPEVQYASEKLDAPIELRVYPGAGGTFTLYEDEGDNYDYEKGMYATIPLTWDDKAQTLTIGARQGQFPGMQIKRTFNVVWVSPGHGAGTASSATADVTVPYAGEAVTVPRKR